jgi:hypothetical protein
MRLALVLLAALALAGPAAAGDIGVHLAFVPGKLTVSAAPSKTASVVTVTVADGRGSGAGWTLSFRSAAPAVTSITASCASGSTCTLPRAASAPSGSTVLRAAPGTGMGVIRLTIHLASAARVGLRVG